MQILEKLFSDVYIPQLAKWYLSIIHRTPTYLQPRNEQEAIPQSDHHNESDYTSRYASGYEMLYTQVALTCLRVLQHDRRWQDVSEEGCYTELMLQ